MIDRASVSRARFLSSLCALSLALPHSQITRPVILLYSDVCGDGDDSASTIDRRFQSVAGWKAPRHNKPIVSSSIHAPDGQSFSSPPVRRTAPRCGESITSRTTYSTANSRRARGNCIAVTRRSISSSRFRAIAAGNARDHAEIVARDSGRGAARENETRTIARDRPRLPSRMTSRDSVVWIVLR